MNKPKHTPGPWSFDTELNQVNSSDGDLICENISYYDGVLIAAAPELLEALEICRDELLRLSPTASSLQIEDADLAIAKARADYE